eukprot:2802054-Prorocentrum_lima.AAC.1
MKEKGALLELMVFTAMHYSLAPSIPAITFLKRLATTQVIMWRFCMRIGFRPGTIWPGTRSP